MDRRSRSGRRYISPTFLAKAVGGAEQQVLASLAKLDARRQRVSGLRMHGRRQAGGQHPGEAGTSGSDHDGRIESELHG